MADGEADVKLGTALAQIAEEAPESLELIGNLIERNARDLEWQFEQLYLGEKAQHDRTKERLAYALARIATIEDRMDWLLARGQFSPLMDDDEGAWGVPFV